MKWELVWLYYHRGIGRKKVLSMKQQLDRAHYRNHRDQLLLDFADREIGRSNLSQELIGDEIANIKWQLKCKKVGVIAFWEDQYPPLLRQIIDYPVFLFYKGNFDLVKLQKCVAIVGTRAMSEYGRLAVPQIVRPLADAGYTIVSGLATGVDAHAHRCMLDTNPDSYPVAVLPAGPEAGIPASNRDLYQQILKVGGLVLTEFPPGTPIKPNMFALRNRIVAGLSQGVVVVEAPKKSGALITADLALQNGREVCAVPGSAFNTQSQGTNDIIRQGAQLVCDGWDVLSLLGENIEKQGDDWQLWLCRKICREVGVSKRLAGVATKAIFDGGVAIDELGVKLNVEQHKIRSALTKLDLEGILRLDLDGKVKIGRKLC